MSCRKSVERCYDPLKHKLAKEEILAVESNGGKSRLHFEAMAAGSERERKQ